MSPNNVNIWHIFVLYYSLYTLVSKTCFVTYLTLVRWQFHMSPGLSLHFVAHSCLSLHPSTLHPTRLQQKKVSVKPETRSPSYAAGKNLTRQTLGSDNRISCTLLPHIRSWYYTFMEYGSETKLLLTVQYTQLAMLFPLCPQCGLARAYNMSTQASRVAFWFSVTSASQASLSPTSIHCLELTRVVQDSGLSLAAVVRNAFTSLYSNGCSPLMSMCATNISMFSGTLQQQMLHIKNDTHIPWHASHNQCRARLGLPNCKHNNSGKSWSETQSYTVAFTKTSIYSNFEGDACQHVIQTELLCS